MRSIATCNKFGARGEDRTRDLFVTSEVLYQLSYSGEDHMKVGAKSGNRTRDLFLTMEVLYQLSYLGLLLETSSNHSTKINL